MKKRKTSASIDERATENVPPQANSNVADIASAKNALSKLPILGPALWLYARDPLRRFTFMADIDWLLLPPVVLDQCRLYTKNEIPFAFFTWAKVTAEVDQRLRSGIQRIAPHEWQGGEHIWLIDVVTPFGQFEEMIAELHKTQFAEKKISALLPDQQQENRLIVRDWAA